MKSSRQEKMPYFLSVEKGQWATKDYERERRCHGTELAAERRCLQVPLQGASERNKAPHRENGQGNGSHPKL